MVEHRQALQLTFIHGPFAARPDPEGLPDWFGYASDEGPLYRVLNDAWVTVGPGSVEERHLVGEAGEPAFATGYSNFGSGFRVASFWKDSVEMVHLEGLVQATGTGGLVFTLPSEYRPASAVQFATFGYKTATYTNSGLTIGADGTIGPFIVAPWTTFSLSGIAFRADA